MNDKEYYNNIFLYKDGQIFNKVKRGNNTNFKKPVGSSSNGYLVASINGKTFRVHRIIWNMHYGDIPDGLEIDHIDRNRSNNKITNLRLVTRQENNYNTVCRKTNKSGFLGVSWDKINKKWRASITHNYKTYNLGRFTKKEEAIKARQYFIKNLI